MTEKERQGPQSGRLYRAKSTGWAWLYEKKGVGEDNISWKMESMDRVQLKMGGVVMMVDSHEGTDPEGNKVWFISYIHEDKVHEWAAVCWWKWTEFFEEVG